MDPSERKGVYIETDVDRPLSASDTDMAIVPTHWTLDA